MAATHEKKTEKKAFVKAEPFSSDEIIRVAELKKTGWLKFKEAAQTEGMKKYKVRHFDIMCDGIDATGNLRPERPLFHKTEYYVNDSACTPIQGEEDTGKKPDTFTFGTRIHFRTPPEGKAYTDHILKIINDIIEKDLPNKDDLSDEEYNAEVEKKKKRAMSEYRIELARYYIAREFERMLESAAERKTIKWTKGEAKIKSHVQWLRKRRDDEDTEEEMIPLDEPIARFRIKANREDGKLWCPVMDVASAVMSRAKKTGSNKFELTVARLSKNGVMVPVDASNICEYLRPRSVLRSLDQYKLVISAKSAALHAIIKRLEVRRSNIVAKTVTISADEVDGFGDDYGDNFDTSMEAPGVEESKVPAAAPAKAAAKAAAKDAKSMLESIELADDE